MCERYSCVQDSAGRIYDGGGLTHSHADIIRTHHLDDTDLALYEWQPPDGWPRTSWLHGLTVDKAPGWTRKQSHDRAMRGHLLRLYPDMAAWDAPDVLRAIVGHLHAHHRREG